MNFLLEKKLLENLSTHVLTSEEVYSYISDLIDYLEIKDYLKSIKFNDKEFSNVYGVYNFVDKSIIINIDKICKNASKLCKTFNIKENKILYINLNIMLNIFHEVNHSCQNDLIHTLNTPVVQEFHKELLQLTERDNVYKKYHDYLSFERDSVSTSYENVLSILKDYHYDEYIYSVVISFYEQFLVFGYRNGSPIETVYKNIFKEKYKDNLDLDDFSRVRLGYPVKDKNIVQDFTILDSYIIK